MIHILLTSLITSLVISVSPKSPPGTIHLKDNIYVDQSEVSNLDWMEYLSWLKQEYGENASEYLNALPDSEIWSSLYNTDFPTSWINSEITYYPVVGISFSQASAYCKWRTMVVNQKFQHQFTVTYRLPNESEFLEVETLENNVIYNHYDETLGLFRSPGKAKGNYTLYVSNNVSEMTDIEGRAFGGNFMDDTHSTKMYSSPEKWLGFRCIAEMSN